jgi:hypothetical protein
MIGSLYFSLWRYLRLPRPLEDGVKRASSGIERGDIGPLTLLIAAHGKACVI